MEHKDFEVKTNIKFLVKLGWKGTEIIQALQTVYKDHVPKKTWGLKDFEMLEKLLKMMRVVEDQQPQKTMKKLILLGT